jgi:NAD(P)-dependent dehydrogenase (short-subunit alcohol dehydrogenase family)
VRLEGKVAIVFGAGPDMGGTIAHFLAREGARVAVNDIKAKAAEETVAFLRSRNLEAVSIPGDATAEADIARIINETVAHYGRVDTVVNMAGRIHWSPIVDMVLSDWNDALLSFPTAGMLTTKHAARAMIAGEVRGSIIHILSTAAHFGEASGACYTAGKAALQNLARSAAMDLAHDGIRVNTITPCGMEHQLWTRMSAEAQDPNYVAPRRRSFYSRDDYLKMIPLERFPRSSDLAWAAVFLASDESCFLTGIDIPVDGGLRYKYPVWRPGDFTGINIEDYKKQTYITEYGEPVRKLVP